MLHGVASRPQAPARSAGACRRVVDFDGDGDLAYLEKQLEAATGFTIFGHHLEIYGICPRCAAATSDVGEAPPDAS